MKVNLRFGMHRDTEVVHQDHDKLDGLIMPAHILAYQPAATSVFLTSLPRHPYVIDPMTFLFQDESQGEVRASVRKLCEAYHAELLSKLEAIPVGSAMSPADLPEVGEFCQGVVEFQREAVAREAKTTKAAKYIARKGFGRPQRDKPRLIVSPYFRFSAVGDRWYKRTVQCVQETVAICRREETAAVVHCSSAIVSDEEIERIVEDFSACSGVLLWLDDFNQLIVEEADIERARRLTQTLSRNCHVETLYGGYLLMLLDKEGMSGISHGILFAQHKAAGLGPGAGGVPERYYIPAFHDFRSLSQTDLIFHKHEELICNCEICEMVLGGNPDNLIHFEDEPELLRRHFLTVRNQEKLQVDREERPMLVEELKSTFSSYHASISVLPNPDAVKHGSLMMGLSYLERWADGLTSSI